MGRENEIIWYLNQELINFREKTKGQIVLMGKRAWETIPSKDKPYSDRFTVIATRDLAFTTYHENINVVYDLEWYIKNYCDDLCEKRSLWVIGGSDILHQTVKFADKIEVTEVLSKIEGDILSPKIDGRSFKLNFSGDVITDSFNNSEYFKSVYSRISKSCVKQSQTE